jgi:hypothetical protein
MTSRLGKKPLKGLLSMSCLAMRQKRLKAKRRLWEKNLKKGARAALTSVEIGKRTESPKLLIQELRSWKLLQL